MTELETLREKLRHSQANGQPKHGLKERCEAIEARIAELEAQDNA
jgi:hypothetical protein